MSVNSRLKSHLDHRSKESILQAESFQSLVVQGKKTVDVHILVTSRNGDRKVIHSIRITSRPSSRIWKWNQFCQFWWRSTKEYLQKRLKLATFQQRAKGLANVIFECTEKGFSIRGQLVRDIFSKMDKNCMKITKSTF